MRKARRDRPESGSRDGTRVALCVFAPLLIGVLCWYHISGSRAAAGEFGYPLDDSWIHVRFAQHLLQARGFSFNPGELTSTTTGALWTVLLALAHRVTREFLLTSIVLNAALCVLLCLVVYELTLTLVPSRWLALLAGVTVAVTAPLPWWALSGMEPPLYATLALLGVLLHVRGRRSGAKVGIPAALAFGLAGLARPECLLLFPLAMLDRLIVAKWVDRDGNWASRWVKDLAVQLPVFALVACPPFIYNHVVTGYWLPSSFYSKQQWVSISGALARADMKALLYVIAVAPWLQLGSLLATWAADNAALIAPLFIGLGWLTWEVVRGRGEHRSLLIPMALIVQPMLWAPFAGYRPADYQSQRYLAALNPLFLLMGLVGGWWIVERVSPLRARPARVVLAAAVLAASLARQPASAATYALNVKNITEMQVTIGRWLRDHAPRGALLALNDVGAIAVITDDPVLDLQGLVTPQVLALRSLKRQAEGTAPALLSQYVFERRPDYMGIFPEWYPEMDARRDLLTPVFGVQLSDNITSGRPAMVVYQTVWAKAHGKEAKL